MTTPLSQPPAAWHRALLALGANLGDRAAQMNAALDLLRAQSDVRLVAHSRWRATRPVGGPAAQPEFLNGAALLETTRSPQATWQLLQQIEGELGRARELRWGPRPIDLDLLLYDDVVMHEPTLTLPHPRFAWRRFVLEPAAEIAGTWQHPVLLRPLQELWQHLLTTWPYLAITGSWAAELTEQVVRRCGAKRLDREELASLPRLPGPNASTQLLVSDVLDVPTAGCTVSPVPRLIVLAGDTSHAVNDWLRSAGIPWFRVADLSPTALAETQAAVEAMV